MPVIAAWTGELARIPAILRLIDSAIVENELGASRRATVSLAQPATPEEITSEVRSVLNLSKRRQKVLIVDDDKLPRRMTAALLETAGYAVSEASNGKEALDYASRLKPDVVLTELVMQEAEGLQLIQQLLELDPQLKIVGMSGAFREEDYLKIARTLGAKAMLLKPLTGEVLLQTLRDMSLNSSRP